MTRLLSSEEKKELLTRCPSLKGSRDPLSHKGTHGSVGIIGGSKGMTGAIILSAMAALKTGAGRVYLGFNQPKSPLAYISTMPELMMNSASSLLCQENKVLQTINSWLLGPGLGLDSHARTLLNKIGKEKAPLLLDADALTLLANSSDSINPTRSTLITPHLGEASRLLKEKIQTIEENREAAACELSHRYKAITILKGPHTLVAYQNRIIWANPTGNAGLATAGSGDVLAGIISSLIAQGIPPIEAAIGGVWMHGKAADLLVKKGVGPIGLTASELIPMVRIIRNALTHSQKAE